MAALYMNIIGTRYMWDRDLGKDKCIEKQNEIYNVFPEIEPFDIEGGFCVKHIEANLGCWRNANAIHKWFVDNIQQGKDDCGEYDVSVKELQKLLDIVHEILADKSKAPELLPTQKDFVYGKFEYDKSYWKDVEYTKELLEKIVNSAEDMKRWHLQLRVNDIRWD
jgi:hypothetical protein